MVTFNPFRFILVLIVILITPLQISYAVKPDVKEIENRLKGLEEKTSDSQVQTLGLIGTVADNMTKKLEARKKELQKDEGFKENLDIKVSSISDIEKAREKLKREIKDWTEYLEYTEMNEIKKGVSDALAVAKADNLNIEKLTRIYNLTKKIIRSTQFRSAGTTARDRLQNLDLDRAETDRRLQELESKKTGLQEQINNTSYLNIFTLENLKMELAGVEAEILQHRMGIRHEDISQPMYILMDGVLSGITAFSRVIQGEKENVKRSDLEDHRFDSDAPRELMENYVLKLVTFGFEGEAMVAEAAAERQKFRKNLYKRSAIAFIRALISGKDSRECAVRDMKPVIMDYNGKKIKVLGCPDPLVENLRAYLDAFRKFQDAELDRAIAEGKQLVAEQQIIADFMAVVPLVSDAMDIYSVYSGENLAGEKLSPVQRGVMGVFSALPLVGPHAVKQIYERYEEALKPKLDTVVEFFQAAGRAMAEVPEAMGTIGNRFPDEFLDLLSRKTGMDVTELKRMIQYFDNKNVIDDAARARMKLFKTMRDASEDRILVHTLMGSEKFAGIFKRAKSESDALIKKNLLLKQGTEGFNSFMPASHRKAFAEVAKKERKIIAMRPVGQDAAEQLAKNFAGTKGLHIKPKSSNWGPHKAFIPVEQQFSKLGKPGRNIDWDEIAKYKAKAEACIKKNCANTVPLKVSIPDETIPVDVVIVKKGGSEIPVYRNSRGEFIDPDTMSPLRGSDIDKSEIRPMDVFADADGNPLTADYDLLAVGSERRIQTSGSTEGAGFDVTTGRQTPRNAGNKGTITEEINETVEQLNTAGREVGGYTKGKLVHHGPETFNPVSEGIFTASEMEEGLALTIFDPDYGELAIPACGEECMKNWCRTSELCDPDYICPEGIASGCIPADPGRLLKDYFHNARLRGIDIAPHSSWNWGKYNGLGGWTQTGFLGVPSGMVEGAKSSFRKELEEAWHKKVAEALCKIFGIEVNAAMSQEE